MNLKVGFIWDLVGKSANQLVSFVISIVLARLLGPEQFGLIGMALVVINISQVFGDMGLSMGLVQRKRPSPIQINTIFWINVGLGLTLTVIITLLSGNIAVFFDEVELKLLVRLLATLFLLKSVSIVPRALLKKEVNFKSLSIINLLSLSISGAITIILVINDFGVIALAIMHLSESILSGILVWKFIAWRPKLKFELKSIYPIWKYSSNLLIAGMIETIFTRLDVIIIGKIFSPATLGFYSRAISFYNLVIRFASDSFSQVLFPFISKIQDNLIEIRRLILKSYHLISFIIFGLIGLLYLISDELIITLLTDKWLETSFYFKILLLSAYAYPVSTIMMNVLSGLGFSQLILKLEVYKKLLLLLTYIIGFQFGIIGFLYGLIVNRTISTVLNIYFASKKIDLSFSNLLVVLLKYGIGTLVSIYISNALANYVQIQSVLLQMIFKTLVFLTAYLAISKLQKSEGLKSLLDILNSTKKDHA